MAKKDPSHKKARKHAGLAQAAPAGDWLWLQLMDFCQRRGVHPADYNDLFAIVSRAREENAKRTAQAGALSQRLRRAAKSVFDNGDDDAPALCLVSCEDARSAAALLNGELTTSETAKAA